MAKLLRLGIVDENVRFSPTEKRQFFDRYHHPYGFTNGNLRFRDDSRNEWRKWEPGAGAQVQALTEFLQGAGFMPYASHDGIFGYVTQAAVRLFQEYVRTVDSPERHRAGDPPSWPDGVVGNDTRFYIDAWQREQKQCRWYGSPATDDYAAWLDWLRRAKRYYTDHPSRVMRHLRLASRRGDSLLPAEWTYSQDDPHLIGLRRGAEESARRGKREADDLFVLLLNGRSFYFSGSTDANPRQGQEGYLIEGQHRYRFNWHNISASKRERIYKAARPAGEGVMVVRDVHHHDALTEENRADGFDPFPNPTFNIHWNGLGISNWSAGCQTINGSAYLNDVGETIGCQDYAARRASERGNRREAEGPRLTMGAYTVLSDLLLCYTKAENERDKPILRYSLFEAGSMDLIPGLDRRRLNDYLTTLANEIPQ
jgi:hypothetical protein